MKRRRNERRFIRWPCLGLAILWPGFRFRLGSLARAWRIPGRRRAARQAIDLFGRPVVIAWFGVGAAEFRIDFAWISHELLAFAVPPTRCMRPCGLISKRVVSPTGTTGH